MYNCILIIRIKIACSYAGIQHQYNIQLPPLHHITYLFPLFYLVLPESKGRCIIASSCGSKLLDLARRAIQLTKKSIESEQIAISTTHTML